MRKISIVIPVFCNEASLPKLFDRLLDLENNIYKDLKLNLELIFIDDGSTDNSWQELIKFKGIRKKTKIIKLTRNFGGVNTVKIGFQNVTGDAFTMLAADLQDPPELIHKMATKWKKGEMFIVCERDSREDSFFKILFAKIYYMLIRLLVIKDYPKGGFDLALMDKVFLPYLQNSSKNCFPPILAYWMGFKPYTIRYKRQKREFGKSSWTFWRNINTFLDILFGFSNIPLRIISILGLILVLASFIYMIILVYLKIKTDELAPGFSTLAILNLFTLGFTILSIGILGEYIWKILNQIDNKPDAIEKEKFLD